MKRIINNPLRVIGRLIRFAVLILKATLEFFWIKITHQATRTSRNQWLHSNAQKAQRILNLAITFRGKIPDRGAVVCNHLSYLDIVVLSSLFPATFISKYEVKWWPIIGWLTQGAGTLYIRRQDKSDLKRLHGPMNDILQGGGVLVLFPEGTSSNGRQVLPFHSSLFEPIATHQHATTAVGICYKIADGKAEDEVCYWRDMTFAPHLLNLFAIETTMVLVEFGSRQTPVAQNRKQLAKTFHAQVAELVASKKES